MMCDVCRWEGHVCCVLCVQVGGSCVMCDVCCVCRWEGQVLYLVCLVSY